MVPEIVARSNVIITCHHIISRHAKYNTKYNMEYLFFFNCLQRWASKRNADSLSIFGHDEWKFRVKQSETCGRAALVKLQASCCD